MEDNSTCKRFLVLGSARTGSTYLMSLLSAHKNVKMYGELFNLDKIPKAMLSEVLENPLDALKRRINVRQGGDIQAVGFKIFYDHLTKEYFNKIMSPDKAAGSLKERLNQFDEFFKANYVWDDLAAKFQETWDYLFNDSAIKVIHLKRQNKLETMVSLKTAFLTDEWMVLRNKQSSQPVLDLEYDECLNYFRKLDDFEKKYNMLFKNHQMMEITYEELVTGKDKVMGKIFNFLGVPENPVSTIMEKQNTSGLRDRINNYEQLKENFKASPWQAFFS